MPLIGSKLHVLNPVWRKKKSKDSGQQQEETPERDDKPSFIVPDTHEICSSLDELQRKCTVYNEKIWTCRVTGKSNLTFKDALKAELNASRILRKSFPKFFEKAVLEHVHLSSLSLESLVHSCWTLMHEQFHLAEPVRLKVDSVSSKPIEGVIDDVIKLQMDQNNQITTSPCNSDKENVSKKPSPMKKNYTYSVRVLTDGPMIVHDISASSIDRLNKVPSKEVIRMFIRSHAMRYGPNYSGPWIVNSEVLKRYKILPKDRNCRVDKVKLKQMSMSLEEEFFYRIMNSRRQAMEHGNSDGVGTGGDGAAPTGTPLHFKRSKRFSVLMEDNLTPRKTSISMHEEDDMPLSCLKNRTQLKNSQLSLSMDEIGNKKKMRQITLFQFGKKDQPNSSHLSSPISAKKASNSLPRIAQHLVKMYNENPDHPSIPAQIALCAKCLSYADLAKLSGELRERVRIRKDAIEHRRKLMNMSPNQRKEYMRTVREKQRLERLQANKLIDDKELADLMSDAQPLPIPTKIVLPCGLTDSLFGRLLSVAEFFHCFCNMLVDTSLDDSDHEGDHPVNSGFVKSPVDSLVGEMTDDDGDGDCIGGADEEEAYLTELTAPLPKSTIRSLRQLGIQRLVDAVSASLPSAGAYRSMARPLGILLRLLLRNEKLGKKREMGIKLCKLPVTPYTAPEMLRLVLRHQLVYLIRSKNLSKSVLANCGSGAVQNGFLHLNELMNVDGANVEAAWHSKDPDMLSSLNLVRQLQQLDLYELKTENRVAALEIAVEHLFEYDLIDDHIVACQRRSTEAYQKRLQLLKDKNLKKKDKKEAVNTNQANASPKVEEPKEEDGGGAFDEDLASIVKRRRILAARAAVEREEKEQLERQRRTVLAQECAEERMFAQANRLYELHLAEARCALRCQPLGYDRFYRRLWYFRCAPDRLFVESNWASVDMDYRVSCTKDNSRGQFNDVTVQEKRKDDLKSKLPLNDESGSICPQPAYLQSTDGTTRASWSSWFVYDKPEQLETLVRNLLPRGLRESHLKSQLTADGFIESIKNRWIKSQKNARDMSPSVVNADASNETDPDAAKSEDNLDNNLSNRSRKSNAQGALAGALLKNMLDTEVRLRSGGLGGVTNFVAWQEHLAQVQNSFGLSGNIISPDKCKNLQLSNLSPNDTSPDRVGLVSALIEIAENIMPRFLNVPDLASSKNRQTDQQHHPNCGDNGFPVDGSSSSDSNDDDSSGDDGRDDNGNDSANELILDPEAHESRTQAWLNAWRIEVKQAKTLSRLNLLHACLDSCVRWEKSVEDARCRVCRRKTDDDNLLLCDGCNLAFHLYCLRPPLKRVPVGDWFCPTCRPASRTLDQKRREQRLLRSERRRKEVLSSDDDDSDDDDERSDGESNAEHRRSYRKGGGRRRSAKTAGVSSSSISTTSKCLPNHDSVCLVCEEELVQNEKVQCSHCPNAFHLACHEPPLHHVPRGDSWTCTTCRFRRKQTSSSRQSQSRESRRAIYLRHCKKKNHDNESSDDQENRKPQYSFFGRRSRNTAVNSNNNNSSSLRRGRLRLVDSDSGSCSDSSTVAPRLSNRRRASLHEKFGYSKPPPAKRPRRQSAVEDDQSSSESEQVVMDGGENKKPTCDMEHKYALRIIEAIVKHKHAWPFMERVDKDKVPDYYEIITDPMDLSLIQSKHSNHCYDTPDIREGLGLLMEDLGTMFYNAELYNAADSDVWIAGRQLEKFVQLQFSQLDLDVIYSRAALGDM